MTILPSKVILKLQQNAANVRNICVLAHVDHGKTSICDALIASNGIISKKLSGKVRYLDYRDDEQVRQITMKTSSISLYTQLGDQHHLLNLVDSPGHVDFSGEVSSAVRLTDGALLVVDCIEGVCVQTQTVLRQAASEGLQMILIINKIDRLVFEKNFSIEEATDHLEQLVNSVNNATAVITDDNGTVFGDDYFDPIKGNVVFASAIDGWGFDLVAISEIYAKKFGMKEESLRNILWGEHFINMKTGKTFKTQIDGTMKVFSQLALKPIWDIYNTVHQYFDNKTKEAAKQRIIKISTALGMNIGAREFAIHEEKSFLFSMMNNFVPIAKTILRCAVLHLPSPLEAQPKRINKIYSTHTSLLKDTVVHCDASSPECVLYAAKIFPFGEQMIALCRVLGGTVRRGQELFILPSKYDPTISNAADKIHSFKANQIYLLMGQTTQDMDEVPAGNILGIQVTGVNMFNAATLSSTLQCSPLAPLVSSGAKPVLRVAIEPVHSEDMKALIDGLNLLALSDPSVITTIQDSGENLLLTTGELHLERCMKDLKELFARVPFTYTDPIVSYRETILGQSGAAEESTADESVSFKVHCLAMKEETIDKINDISTMLRMSSRNHQTDEHLNQKIETILEGENNEWKNKLICFGPKRCGPNILINLSDENLPLWPQDKDIKNYTSLVTNAIISGFQLATSAGPLCDEPMEGLIFIIDEILIDEETRSGNIQGQVITAFKDACLAAFQLGRQRIKEPMYLCDIRCPTECIGKVFQVLDKRRAKTLEEGYDETQLMNIIKAQLPVAESFGFTDDMLGQTSGAAFTQTQFDRFVTIPIDPFWVPTTEEELEEYGEKADIKNIAKIAIDNTRKRKGLVLDEKIVEFVDKQSTRSKKK
ncbi:elongation factor 2, putative [Entamoeba histolytica HM-1:IMSS-B]|uniref:Elongation factor-like 1 n=6 Tax=Entamoeba histolytica TaxID=5759 RepID=C4LWB7_ENTH1|nr:Elongation factor 2, putative [Entamoeba histolytica HM-1:IMSS]EMD46125.1 elongation factor 2, putative [Entamoeba histolytica KU27]EMH72567.1 elongation factor 2, putative [Entamoeba histolytica HM-1:IMSS-B]EMS15116.1 elongation factor 2, putative [Entamoeba histolytica HM-3:IMSS]ENY64515.1 elongation factor 2, putative [Entamoeba histolytica HM-1:IMSS-A]GAT92996.1 elongation factor 2 putative [Entamoeba histolytica]|eukprot:XP_655775.1 Elongation factor 2, putative [Entamoeba histolytica HM-1:IMSS]